MADEANGATAAESPAGAAQEPSSPFSEAKAELASVEGVESTTPAAGAPDPLAEDTVTETADDAGTEGTDSERSQPAGSRRQRGQQLEAQIEQRVRERMEREQAERRQADEASQNTEAFRSLTARAKGGEWKAIEEYIAITEGRALIRDGRVVERQPAELVESAITRGRTAVLEELSRDFASIRGKLEGATEADYAALFQAPTIDEYGRRAFEIGRRPLLARITTLETENASLRGQLTGARPSPVAASGASRGAGEPQLTGMQAYAAEARALLEARI